VAGKDESRKQPAYNLAECREAVAAGRYRLSRAALHFIMDYAANNPFPFSEADLQKFIASLSGTDFVKSVKYQNVPRWWDIYKADYEITYTDEYDEIRKENIHFYLKFHLMNGGTLAKVEIVSFHEDR
jgi:hypothetical protein